MRNLIQGDHVDAFVHRVGLLAGIDDPRPLELQVLHGNAERLGHGGRVARLEFDTVTLAAAKQEQIQLRARVPSPEERLALTRCREDLLERDSLRRGAVLGMGLERLAAGDCEQRVLMRASDHVHTVPCNPEPIQQKCKELGSSVCPSRRISPRMRARRVVPPKVLPGGENHLLNFCLPVKLLVFCADVYPPPALPRRRREARSGAQDGVRRGAAPGGQDDARARPARGARGLPGARAAYLIWDVAAHRERILKGELPPGKLWVFDEIHKYRRWRNYLKGVYDGRPRAQRILVAGSGRLDLYRFGGDSLQGRYHLLRLHPFSVAELGMSRPSELLELLRLGGFPEPFLSGSELQARRWSREYRTLLVREEIAALERIQDPGAP